MVFLVLTRALSGATKSLGGHFSHSLHKLTCSSCSTTGAAAIKRHLSAEAKPPPVNLEIPPEYEGSGPDPIEMATGLEKKQYLALLAGDSRYEPKVYERGLGTKEHPNIVSIINGDSRIVGCVCEPDQCYINYMSINLGEMKRCECGYWYKAVKGDPDIFC